jgi:hypothetical protein
MTIPSISGDDDINQILNAAMYATLKTLTAEKYITEEQSKEIQENYVAVFVKKDGGFINWLKAKFGKPSDMVVVMKTFV